MSQSEEPPTTIDGRTKGSGCEFAFAARQRAHPEIDLLTAGLMTFDEYSSLYDLDPAEPFASRLDEYAIYFSYAAVHITRTLKLPWTEECQALERVAVLAGAKTFDIWAVDAYRGPSANGNTMIAFRQYVFDEACAHAWSAHIAMGPPYGPRLLHAFLRSEPRFQIPQAILESPIQRYATADDADDDCAICRTDKALGELLVVLPCTGHAGHSFHPHCINPWINHVGRQQCVFNCRQRVIGGEPAAEHNNYNYEFTFPSVGVTYVTADGEYEDE